MFDSVKEALNKDIGTEQVKKFLSMEIEIQQLKELLEKEVKIKEFLLQDIDVKEMVSLTPSHIPSRNSNATVKRQTSDRRKHNSRREGEKDENGTIDDCRKDELRKLDDRRTIFDRRESDTTSKVICLPPYDLGLITVLKKHHKELIFIYENIMLYAKKKKYSTAKNHLAIFSEQFTDYFHIADQQLYAYLKIYINLKQPERKKAFSALNLEMKNLYLSIYYSLNQSPNMPLNEANHDGFMYEFGLLGDQLKERFEREEKVLMKIYEESNESENISSLEATA